MPRRSLEDEVGLSKISLNCYKLWLGGPDVSQSVSSYRHTLKDESDLSRRSWKQRWMKFYYVYILQSESEPKHYYTGFTENLETRLKAHNSGQVMHTAKYKPWRIKTTIAFTDQMQALNFEKYLKSPSGRAFAKKRL